MLAHQKKIAALEVQISELEDRMTQQQSDLKTANSNARSAASDRDDARERLAKVLHD